MLYNSDELQWCEATAGLRSAFHHANAVSDAVVVVGDVDVAQHQVEASRQVDSEKEVISDLTLQDDDDCFTILRGHPLHSSDEIPALLSEIGNSDVCRSR